MAATFATVVQYPAVSVAPGLAPRKMNVVEMTCDNAYGAGGYAITAANCGMTKLDYVCAVGGGITGAGAGTTAHFDRTNSKIKLYKGNTAAILQEVAATDVNTFVIALLAFGE